MTYDNNGSSITYSNNVVNEYTDIDGATPEYDAAGNLTKDTSSYEYFYDAENKLTRIEDSSNTLVASFKYDAYGRRIEKTDSIADPDVTRRYYYDNRLRVLEEYNAAETPARQKYYIWGGYIDELLLINHDSSDYFVCNDYLYSPVAIIDSSANITEWYDYDVYGSPTIYTGDGGDSNWWNGNETTATVSSIANPYFFIGRRLDLLDGDSLKIMYYRARYYDPGTGRFISRDPIGYVDGMSLYEYVRSSPVNWLDPFGLHIAPGPLGPIPHQHESGHDMDPRNTSPSDAGLHTLPAPFAEAMDKELVKATAEAFAGEIPYAGPYIANRDLIRAVAEILADTFKNTDLGVLLDDILDTLFGDDEETSPEASPCDNL